MSGMINIQLLEEDYLAAQALHLKSQRWRTLASWSALLILGCTTTLILLYGRDSISSGMLAGIVGGVLGGLIGGVVATLGIRYLYGPWKLRRIFRQQKSLRLPFQVSWTEDGFTSSSEQGSVKTKWSEITKWKEDDRIVLLYISDVMFHIFPKRAFSGGDILSRFRHAVAEHVVT